MTIAAPRQLRMLLQHSADARADQRRRRVLERRLDRAVRAFVRAH